MSKRRIESKIDYKMLCMVVMFLIFNVNLAMATVNLDVGDSVGDAVSYFGDGLNYKMVKVDFSITDLATAEQALKLKPGDNGFQGWAFGKTDYPDFTDGSPLQEQNYPINHPFPFDDTFVAEFTGFINIPQSILTRYDVFSDDGFSLEIGDKLISYFDGLRPAGYGTAELVQYDSSGFYPLRLLMFENNGGASVELGHSSLYMLEPGSLFSYNPSVVPEPATVSLLGVGLLGLVTRMVRRKK